MRWGKGYYGLVVQRLDGFVSADAPAQGGQLETPAMVFEGNRLTLNMDASAADGSALVAILDASGNPLPGFSIADCDVIRLSDVDYTVTWNGKSDVSSLAGMSVRLLFEMHSTKLYAFQFLEVPEPSAIALWCAPCATMPDARASFICSSVSRNLLPRSHRRYNRRWGVPGATPRDVPGKPRASPGSQPMNSADGTQNHDVSSACREMIWVSPGFS